MGTRLERRGAETQRNFELGISNFALSADVLRFERNSQFVIPNSPASASQRLRVPVTVVGGAQ